MFRRRRSLFRVVIAVLALARTSAADEPPLLPIAEAMQRVLASDKGFGPVRIEGVIAGVSWDVGFLIVQDESAAMWIVEPRVADPERTGDVIPHDLRPGLRVRLDGRVDRGAYAPRFVAEHVEVLGEESIPQPLPADLDRLYMGLDNAHHVMVEGVVQTSEQETHGRWHLGLAVKSRHMAVLCPRAAAEIPAKLLDATVRITGFVGSVRNSRGEFLAPRLLIESWDDVVVVEPSGGSPFEAPFVPANALARFRTDPLPAHRITTEGVVTLATPSRLLFIQQGLDGVRVGGASGDSFRPGDRVRVAGFVEMTRKIAGIHGAVVERIGEGPPLEPQLMSPDDVARVDRESRRKWMVALPGNYDGCLVRFDARVVEKKTTASGIAQWVLSTGESTLSAVLEDEDAARLSRIVPGADVRVTGVLQIDWVDDPTAARIASIDDPSLGRMTLLLRSADDFEILRLPSWWTPQRLATLLAGLATVLAAVLVWAWILRWRVAATTVRLADEMASRRNAAVEFQATIRERNRLAANLHDTLLQTLRGIDYQIGACRAIGDHPQANPWEHLEVAKRMVNHAAEELRSSVWALRTAPMNNVSFAESLRAIARQKGHGHAEHIDVRIVGEPFVLPQFVAGNLLLVAQEAIHNALEHADAGQIDVEAVFDSASGAVTLRVADDGVGFEPGSEAGPEQGHFGLSGMRERVERLGGTFGVESSPDSGTCIQADVRKREYDLRIETVQAGD